MVDFHIEGRIEQLGPDRLEALARMSLELDERIRAKGGSVLAVDLGQD